jgi:hypothetical protein
VAIQPRVSILLALVSGSVAATPVLRHAWGAGGSTSTRNAPVPRGANQPRPPGYGNETGALRRQAARPARKVELRRRVDQLAMRPGVHPDLLSRLQAGLTTRSSVRLRRSLERAIEQAESALDLRPQFDGYQPRNYVHRERARRRRPSDTRRVKPPPVPTGSGLFALEHWRRLERPEQRARALGWQLRDGRIVRPQRTKRRVPALSSPIGRRRSEYRLTPTQVAGLLHFVFHADEAKALNRALDEIFQPTAEGSRVLFARRAQLLYPDDPELAAGGLSYERVVSSLLNDARFIFIQAPDLTDLALIRSIDSLAARGTPAYALLGDAALSSPARRVWESSESRVKAIATTREGLAVDRRRVDFNKNLLLVTGRGEVVVVHGGSERAPQHGQDVELAVKLAGGNVGLDLLNSMLHDYLRSGGELELSDMLRLRPALRRMIRATPPPSAIEVETAISSSHFAGWGQSFTPREIDIELNQRNDELFVRASCMVDALTVDRSRQVPGRSTPTEIELRRAAIARRAAEGKRIVVSRDPDLSQAKRKRLVALRPFLERAGVEIVDADTVYIDNSAANLLHRLIIDAANDGHDIVVSELVGDDANLAKRVGQASRLLKRHAKRRVEVYTHYAIRPDRSRSAHAAAEDETQGRFEAPHGVLPLLRPEFHGRVWGVEEQPDQRQPGGARLRARMLVSHRGRQGREKPAGWCVLASAHGPKVDKGRVVAIKSARLAGEAARFFERLKEKRARKLKPGLRLARTPLSRRPSLTRRIVENDTPVTGIAYVVADYESDRVMRHDHRPTEIAAAVYRFDPVSNQLVPLDSPRIPTSFSRLMYAGKDALGRPRPLSKASELLSGITDATLAYQADGEEVHNDLVGWIRTVEKQSGLVPLLAGHNMSAHDKLLLNDALMLQGVATHPYLDGDVADTLRAVQQMYPSLPRKGLSAAAWRMFLDTEPSLPAAHAQRLTRFWACLARLAGPWPEMRQAVEDGKHHRSSFDVVVTALLLERQLQALMTGWAVPDGRRQPTRTILTPPLGPATHVSWGDLRTFFITKKQRREEARASERPMFHTGHN